MLLTITYVCFLKRALGVLLMVLSLKALRCEEAQGALIKMRAVKQGLSFVLPEKDFPLAVFHHQGATYIGLPEGAKIERLFKVPKGFTLKPLKAKGGEVWKVRAPQNIFPSFKKEKGVYCLVFQKTSKNLYLKPCFLYGDALKIKKHADHTEELRFPRGLHHVVRFEDPDLPHPVALVLSDVLYEGFGPFVHTKKWSLSPTLQGFSVYLKDPQVKVKGTGIQGKQIIEEGALKEVGAFDMAHFLRKAPPKGHPLFQKALEAFRIGQIRKSEDYLTELESAYPHVRDTTRVRVFKGVLAAFYGHPAESLALLGGSSLTGAHKEALMALAYQRGGRYKESIRLFDRALPHLKDFPQALHFQLLIKAYEGALYMGHKNKALVFLSGMKKSAHSSQEKRLYQLLLKASHDKSESASFLISDMFEFNRHPLWLEYHERIRQKHRAILMRLKVKTLKLDEASQQLAYLSQEGRGGNVEFEVLESLAELYEKQGFYTKALKVYQRFLRHAPEDHPLKEAIFQKSQRLFVKGIYTKHFTPLTRCAFFKTFKEFLPNNSVGEEVMATLTPLFINMKLSGHIIPVLKEHFHHNPLRYTEWLLLCVKNFVHQGQWDDALEVLKHVKPDASSLTTWSQYHALTRAKMNEPQQALSLLGQLSESQHISPLVFHTYVALDHDEKALEIGEKIVKTQKDTTLVDEMAVLLYKNKKASRLSSFLKRLDLKPTPFIQMLLAVQDLKAVLKEGHFSLKDVSKIRKEAQDVILAAQSEAIL